MDFLDLVNQVGKAVKKHSKDFSPMESVTQPWADGCFDSLDVFMIVLYVSEAYGVPQKISEKLFPTNIQELEQAILQHKTSEPASIQEVLDLI